ncbi:MAG: hypothetical protein ACR2NU_06620 [Aeoliella sp.]
MDTTDQPPPFKPASPSQPDRPRLKPQFSMRALFLALTLCAVFFGLVAIVPGITIFLLSLSLMVVQVSLASALLAGALVTEGRKRIFCVAALSAFVLSFWMHWDLDSSISFGRNRGDFLAQAARVSLIAGVRIGLALLGGWIALVATRYWQPE